MLDDFPDSTLYGANMGPTWVLSAQDGLHIDPINLAIRVMLVIISLIVWLLGTKHFMNQCVLTSVFPVE